MSPPAALHERERYCVPGSRLAGKGQEMKQRRLGASLRVSAVGLGCMGMSSVYGPADEAESLRALERSIELGMTFFDTADIYGLGHNERLLARVLSRRRAQVVLATKFG